MLVEMLKKSSLDKWFPVVCMGPIKGQLDWAPACSHSNTIPFSFVKSELVSGNKIGVAH